jgi:hypothetical protein
MTDLAAREVVEKLHQYDNLPSFPKINIHFLATAPGNEHLLKFMTENRTIEFGLKANASVLSRHMVSKKPKFRFRGNGSRRGAPSAISSRPTT